MRKNTLGHELMALNGKDNFGLYMRKMSLGCELRALNGKERTLANKLENYFGS